MAERASPTPLTRQPQLWPKRSTSALQTLLWHTQIEFKTKKVATRLQHPLLKEAPQQPPFLADSTGKKRSYASFLCHLWSAGPARWDLGACSSYHQNCYLHFKVNASKSDPCPFLRLCPLLHFSQAAYLHTAVLQHGRQRTTSDVWLSYSVKILLQPQHRNTSHQKAGEHGEVEVQPLICALELVSAAKRVSRSCDPAEEGAVAGEGALLKA